MSQNIREKMSRHNAELAVSMKLPTYVILNKNLLTSQMPMGLIIRYQTNRQMSNVLMREQSQVIWNRGLRVLLRKQGMFVFYAFKGQYTAYNLTAK